MSWVTLDRICQKRVDLSRIGLGAVADLLVLDGDPLRDPSVLWGDPNRGLYSRAASGWRSKGHGWCCNRSRRQPTDYWEADGI